MKQQKYNWWYWLEGKEKIMKKDEKNKMIVVEISQQERVFIARVATEKMMQAAHSDDNEKWWKYFSLVKKLYPKDKQ